MDNKLIQQYGEDILCYRIRTARQKKRMRYEDFHKNLIQLDKEEEALLIKQRQLGYEPLKPPVQAGWKRFFVLREDVARSRHAPFFENILKKINTYDWSHRKDFKVKKRRRGKKTYVVKTQKLLEPDENHFAKLDFTKNEKQLFHEEPHYHKWLREPMKKFVFNEPWRFVLRVRPNMIDKVKIRDGAIESRLKEINNYLDRNFCLYTQIKLRYGNYRWRYWKESEKYDELNPLKNMTLQEILDAAKEEII